jgi:hypothetical protein
MAGIGGTLPLRKKFEAAGQREFDPRYGADISIVW